MTTSIHRTILLAVSLLLVAVSCFSQGADSDLVTPSAEQILLNVGLSATPEGVMKAFSDERGPVREAAAQVAGERRMTQAIPKLQQLLRDEYELARVAAAGALLVMGDSSGITELQKLIKSPTPVVVTRSAHILASAGDMSGFAEIAARLRSGKAPMGDRIIFTDALPSFRQYEALRVQVRALLVQSALDDPSADVRLVGVQHLESDDSPEAQAALARAQQKETDPAIRGVLEANQQRRAAKPKQQ